MTQADCKRRDIRGSGCTCHRLHIGRIRIRGHRLASWFVAGPPLEDELDEQGRLLGADIYLHLQFRCSQMCQRHSRSIWQPPGCRPMKIQSLVVKAERNKEDKCE